MFEIEKFDNKANKKKGTAKNPRLRISNTEDSIYIYLIDDENHTTLSVARVLYKNLKTKNNIIQSAELVAQSIVNNAFANKIEKVILDVDDNFLFKGFRLKFIAALLENTLEIE